MHPGTSRASHPASVCACPLLALAGAMLCLAGCATTSQQPHDWLAVEDFSRAVSMQKAGGFYPVNPTGAIHRGERRYRSDYASSEDANIDFFTVYGMLDDNFSRTQRAATAAGYTLAWHQTYTDLTGKKRHQATWTKPKPS